MPMDTSLREDLENLWKDMGDEFIRQRVLSCAEGLDARDFPVFAVPTLSEANRYLLNSIERDKTVYYWELPALEELGIMETLSARGNTIKNALPLYGSRGLLGRGGKRMGPGDVYLTSACAITVDGIVIKPQPEGLPVLHPGYNPDMVVIVAGVNKIVDDIKEGLRRAKDLCVPQCARRLELDLPCVEEGRCIECDAPPAMCTVNTVITRKPAEPEIRLLLVGERFGY